MRLLVVVVLVVLVAVPVSAEDASCEPIYLDVAHEGLPLPRVKVDGNCINRMARDNLCFPDGAQTPAIDCAVARAQDGVQQEVSEATDVEAWEAYLEAWRAWLQGVCAGNPVPCPT